MNRPRRKIALVDDDPNEAIAVGVSLQDAGYEAVPVNEFGRDVARASAHIQMVAQGAVCDHRLTFRGAASFTGAELVSDLYRAGFPAVLISQYLDTDQDVSIRQYRHCIPALLARGIAGPDQLSEAITVCENEIAGYVLPQRRGWRSLVRVVGGEIVSNKIVLSAVVPSWSTEKIVRFPSELLLDLQQHLPTDPAQISVIRFIAKVNIGADQSRDLFFTDFELAPHVRDDDGLS